MVLIAAVLAAAAALPPAPPIRTSAAGVEAGSAATVAVATEDDGPVSWRLLDRAGREAAAGRTAAPAFDADAGGRVATFTLPPLPAGMFRLVSPGLAPAALTVAERPYVPLFRDAMSFFYQQRAGVPILAGHVQRPDLARPAGHPRERVGCFAGVDERGVRWPGCADRIDVSGGWYDAGDRGKYVVNAGISVWMLLDAYARAPGAALIADGALALPERANGTPDLLDEARFEIEWMLAMQLPDGARAAVPDGDGVRWIEDAGGLAFHKVSDIVWAPLPIRVEDDRGERALFPPSTAATLNLAAVAAQAARTWRTRDPAFAARCLAAARAAFRAALRHPRLLAENRFTGSGGYGDTDIDDEFFWAAAEIAATAGDAGAIDFVRSSRFATGAPAPAIGWPNTATAGLVSILRAPDKLPPEIVAGARTALLAAAGEARAHRDAQPWRHPAPRGDTGWGSNGDLLSRAVVAGVAYDLAGDPRDRAVVVDAADYVLGRNPLGVSFVSGYGPRAMRFPHHRFWGAGADASFPLPPPGVLSGGPNSRSMTDEVARRMRGHCLPQTCWVDDVQAFTQNEVAINWNAPLAWVAAFLDGTRPGTTNGTTTP